jgi:hypothetical protein
MGGYLACDGARAVTRAEILPTAVAKDVRACGECDPATGPAACAREIERLRGSDKQIADYLDTVHVPRCAQP